MTNLINSEDLRTFMSVMICWNKNPSALHSLSTLASIFTASKLISRSRNINSTYIWASDFTDNGKTRNCFQRCFLYSHFTELKRCFCFFHVNLLFIWTDCKLKIMNALFVEHCTRAYSKYSKNCLCYYVIHKWKF